MTRAKKILRIGLLLLLMLVLIAFFARNYVLDSVSRSAIKALANRSGAHGVEIAEPKFGQAKVVGFRAARWHDLSAQLRFPESSNFEADRVFVLHIDQLDVWMTGGEKVVLAIDGLVIDSTIPRAGQGNGEGPGGDGSGSDSSRWADDQQSVNIPHLECPLDWQLLDPVGSVEQVLPEIVALITSGSARLPLVAEGTLAFVLNEQAATVGIKVAETAEGRALTLEPADVEKLAGHFAEKLTPAEVALVAAQPLRAPELLRLKDDAESTAEKASTTDAQVPEDAYRHVLWSFLLTQKYGARFAKRVTDAHEQGDTGNTAAEREMDLHNNKIGRQYATQGLNRSQILQQVLKDSDVVRSIPAAGC